jgi:hypothetical protein
MEKLSSEYVVYLTVAQTTQLRNHLTTILELPKPMYRYTIKSFSGDAFTVISSGTVDKAGLELLRVSTPAGCSFSYGLIPVCNDDHCKY